MPDPSASSAAPERPPRAVVVGSEVFPPTLREVMLRPWWIGMLALALVVAGIFAWLGQWQLSNAIDTEPRAAGATEQAQPISEIVQPGDYLAQPLVGQIVDVRGSWAPGDFLVVHSRYNNRAEGFWVTGQLRVEAAEPTSLAVAVGWTSSLADAKAAADALSARAAERIEIVDVTGRLISDEGPALPPRDGDPQVMTRMSPAALLSQWHDTQDLDVYRPYLVADEASAGLTLISAPAPEEGSNVNWLNIFYAVEWAVFAGFAFYMWYRLARDAWEKEVEALEEAAPAAS